MRRIVLIVLLVLIGPGSYLVGQMPKTDALGDALPPGALARLGTVRWRAGSPVILAAFSPDGRSLITLGQDFSVQVWDAATGKEIRSFDASGGAPTSPIMAGRMPTAF